MDNEVDNSACKYFMRIAKAIDPDWDEFVVRRLFVDSRGDPADWYDGCNYDPPAGSKPAIMLGFEKSNFVHQAFLRKNSKHYGNAYYFLYDFKDLEAPYIKFNSKEMYDNREMFDSVLAQLLLQVSKGKPVYLGGQKIINENEESIVQVQIDLMDTVD